MTLSGVDDGESYPGSNLSLSQLLEAAKRKLQCPMPDGRCVWESYVSSHKAGAEIMRPCRTSTTIDPSKVKQNPGEKQWAQTL
jgi:hypothetical protein